MTTKRVMKSDVTASVNPMSTLESEHQIIVEHKMNFTAPVKDDTELENSDSNHLSKDTVVKGETILVFTFRVGRVGRLVAITFNVGRTLSFFGCGF